jgi:hypothetical protein
MITITVTKPSNVKLDANQRRALFPADSYDVPLNQLIFR